MNTKYQSPEPQSGAPLLEIRDLRIEAFGANRRVEIVKGLNLTLKRGEVLGLIGESGAGKSSVGLAAMGYAKSGCRISAGKILFDGEDLAAANIGRKRALRGTRIAYVAQSAAASFNPAHRLIDQTTRAAVRNGLMSKRLASETAIELYRQMQLPDPTEIGFRYPHQVSGGQLQRAMTAMAMICKPDLIVFDEPTTALDVTTQVEVLAAIRSLIEKHRTAALYITHDLAVVSQMADRILVLRHGELVEEAPTRTMLAEPQQAYTRSLWSVRKLYKPPAPSDEILLRVKDVSVNYGNVCALKNINITIPRGRTVSIVGESGSGKSTLGRAIMGLVPNHVTGVIEYHGKALPNRVEDRSRSILRSIQMVHQTPDTAMNPRHTVRKMIGRPLQFFQKLRGEALIRRTIELLDLIELDETFLDRFPGELSGGQKQRICIARALAAEPELIICDEVTSALDQVVQEGLLRSLIDIQQRLNVAYIFITHDIATVKAISDEVVVMNKGLMVEQGIKTDVLQPPYPPYTELLLSSVPQMNADWLTTVLASRQEGKPKDAASS